MKKKLLGIILVCVMLLSGCGAETVPSSVPAETEGGTAVSGTTESLTLSANTAPETEATLNGSGSSRYYTDEDIELAKEAVRDWMSKAFEEGTTLKELYYPGDDFTDEFSGSGYNAFGGTDDSMVLGGFFIQSDGTERGTSGYPLWVWILGRSDDGGWYVKDAGY